MKGRLIIFWKGLSDITRGLILGFGIILIIGIFLNLVFFISSHFPSTCLTCHIMKPYYNNWKTSSHKDVNCIECHPIRMGFITSAILKYTSGFYNPKPHSIVDNNRCLQMGCHNNRLLEGKIAYKGTIIFDHAEHIGKVKRGENLKCVSCHSSIVQGAHITVDNDVCYLCHFKGAAKGQSITGCPSCHGVPRKIVEHEGFSFSHESYIKIGVACNQCHVEVAEGDGDVSDEVCHKCHIDRSKNVVDISNLHRIHITDKNINCFNCHNRIKHKNTKMIQPLEITCEKCHIQKHSPQKEIYIGASARGIRDIPSRMFAAQVSCDGCHIKGLEGRMSKGGDKRELIKKACVNCHGKGYDIMLDDWVKVLKQALSFVEPYVKDASRRKVSDAKELFDDMIYNYNLVLEGNGIHNIEYAINILSNTIDKYSIARKMIEPSFIEIKKPSLLREPDGYCGPACHYRLGLPNKVIFEEMHIEFPHSLHATDMGLGCANCHSPEKHKMRIITKDGCMSCHHSGENLNCRQCHPMQVGLFEGELKGKKIKPDVMFTSGITCMDCHNLKEGNHTVELLKGKCVECHGEGYDLMLIKWEQELLNDESSLLLRLSQIEENIDRIKLLGKKLPAGIEDALKDAKFILRVAGEGRGVHNYIEAIRLMREEDKKLEHILNISGK